MRSTGGTLSGITCLLLSVRLTASTGDFASSLGTLRALSAIRFFSENRTVKRGVACLAKLGYLFAKRMLAYAFAVFGFDFDFCHGLTSPPY